MNFQNPIQWDLDLIKRYDLSGPRYTSYPTAVQFDPNLQPEALVQSALSTTDKHAPLSLYVHIPFCAHVCYYCACNKVITRNRDRAQPYLERVYREMEYLSSLYDNNRIVNQLHWGGGTPTFISDNQMRELMEQLRKNFNLRDDDQGDYSIEIDPREASDDTLRVLRECGFNRISLGVQDLDIRVQEAVNRVQPLEQTERVLNTARALGFQSINMDLIYGLPHQTLSSFDATLDEIIRMSLIACLSLTTLTYRIAFVRKNTFNPTPCHLPMSNWISYNTPLINYWVRAMSISAWIILQSRMTALRLPSKMANCIATFKATPHTLIVTWLQLVCPLLAR
ncbi:radical SAM protein [Nitrincola nitratireducens]|uniref:Oxygen-independent coproporphyrinogen III oxidase n=1 Tax=Nitrincola nitratireducens TaxID=1229521 RepID=W9V112_9GAMM|nr:Oxygen-independent coproporphyrinogen-III oxidase [Nitrincola nitratireducens]